MSTTRRVRRTNAVLPPRPRGMIADPAVAFLQHGAPVPIGYGVDEATGNVFLVDGGGEVVGEWPHLDAAIEGTTAWIATEGEIQAVNDHRVKHIVWGRTRFAISCLQLLLVVHASTPGAAAATLRLARLPPAPAL